MNGVVLDASAVLALLHQEDGHHMVARLISEHGASVSTVNIAEAEAKLIDRGAEAAQAAAACDSLPILVAPFTAEMARASASMRGATRALELSLADRACLATALLLGASAVTADRVWTETDVGVDIQLIR